MAEEFFGQAPQEEVFDPNGWEESQEYQQEIPQQEPEQEYYEEPEQEYYEEPEQEYYEETPLLDKMRAKNYDVSEYGSDEELLADIQSDWAQVNSRQQQLEQQMQWIQAQQQPQQEYDDYDEDDEYDDAIYATPEFDPQWANLVEQDESGRFVIRPEYMGSVDPNLAEKVNNYVEWRQQRSNSLIENPVDTMLEQGLENYIDGRIQQAFETNIGERDTQANAESFVQEHQDVLFVVDPTTGSPMVDPNTGDQILSPFGNALNNAHVMLLDQGLNDPVQRHQVAVQLAYNQVGNPYPQQVEEEYDLADYEEEVPLEENNEYYKEQYQEQPFANGPTNPEYMPDGREMPQDLNGMPQHNSLGSLATQLAVHKGFLQPK